MNDDEEVEVVVVRFKNEFHWFRSDREIWVLDRNKWRDEFITAGFVVPDDSPTDRFGITVVNEVNAGDFLEQAASLKVDPKKLAVALADRFDDAMSWWDVSDLFPIFFVDFDRCRGTGFYPHGIPVERYVPDGWASEFEDFATKYTEIEFPLSEKYWVQNGKDLLAELNLRGAARISTP